MSKREFTNGGARLDQDRRLPTRCGNLHQTFIPAKQDDTVQIPLPSVNALRVIEAQIACGAPPEMSTRSSLFPL